VQDPDQDCEEECEVGDLRSSTGTATAGLLRAGVGRVYRRHRPFQRSELLVSRETLTLHHVVISLR
jgi:hypothetical protein